MKKRYLLLVVLLVGVLTITGCKKEEKITLVGKWAHGSYVYTFNEDKTCTYDVAGSKMECTYEVDGDKLSILYNGNSAPFETTYTIEGKKLNIKDSFGSDTIYERQ